MVSRASESMQSITSMPNHPGSLASGASSRANINRSMTSLKSADDTLQIREASIKESQEPEGEGNETIKENKQDATEENKSNSKDTLIDLSPAEKEGKLISLTPEHSPNVQKVNGVTESESSTDVVFELNPESEEKTTEEEGSEEKENEKTEKPEETKEDAGSKEEEKEESTEMVDGGAISRPKPTPIVTNTPTSPTRR